MVRLLAFISSIREVVIGETTENNAIVALGSSNSPPDPDMNFTCSQLSNWHRKSAPAGTGTQLLPATVAAETVAMRAGSESRPRVREGH